VTFHIIDKKTGKRADTYRIPLKEEWAKDLMWADMEGFAVLEDGRLFLLDECGGCVECPMGRFDVVWEKDAQS
jgi:hypothetical protein